MIEVVFVGDFSYGFYHLEITMKPPPFRRICLELFPPASYRHKSKYREPEGFPPIWTRPDAVIFGHSRSPVFPGIIERLQEVEDSETFMASQQVQKMLVSGSIFTLHQWLILPRHPGEHLLKFGNDWSPPIPIKHNSTQEVTFGCLG